MDVTAKLAEYVAGTTFADLPLEAVEASKLNIIDTLACAVGGSKAAGVEPVLEMCRSWGGAPQATVLVHGDRLPAVAAVLVNSVMAHALDFDDTYDSVGFHAGVSIVPAALAVAETRGGVNGQELLLAVTLGLDVACRIGLATTVGVNMTGFMYTATLGGFGSTVAAAKLMGLNAEQTLNALGIMYSMVSGNIQVIADGALTKRMQPGFAARSAIMAVELAQRGVTGAQNVLEGKYGYYKIYMKDYYQPERLTKDLGRIYEGTGLSYKPYPCCRGTHATNDAAVAVARRHRVAVEDIESVEVLVNQFCYDLVCTPHERCFNPQTVVDAQFSLPYTVATALTYGEITPKNFLPEALHNLAIRGLMQKIRPVVGDADWQRIKSESRMAPAEVRVRTVNGQVFAHKSEGIKGDPENPLDRATIHQKFIDCFDFAGVGYTEQQVTRLFGELERLETAPDTGGILASFAAPGR